MRGVCHELPLRLERVDQPIEQAVERRREPPQFVIGVGRTQPGSGRALGDRHRL